MADFLPSDAWREIFVRLPAKEVFRCRAVRKEWRSVIDDRRFVRAYIRKQLSSNTTKNVVLRNSDSSPSHPLCSFDLNALDFDGFFLQEIPATPLDFNYGDKLHLPVAACEGLMLIPPEKPEKKWQIWNPSTHESLELPHGDFDSLKIVATGLGFDESTDDYKAVLIDSRAGRFPGEHEEHVYHTHVYSLKSDSWRTIEDFPWHDVLGKGAISMKSMYSSFQHLIGVFMGGSLNWFFSPHQHKEMIVVLDLRTETYRELKVPRLPDRPAPRVQERNLDVLDSGRLVLIDYEFDIFETKVQNFDVWVMRDYEVEDSWTHLFSVEGRYPIAGDGIFGLRHVAFLNNKLQFCFQDRVGFYLFDVRTGTVKTARPIGLDRMIRQYAKNLETIFSAQVVPDSIFRLHENCGVGGRRRTNTKKGKGSKSKSKGQMMFHDDEIDMFFADSEKWEIF